MSETKIPSPITQAPLPTMQAEANRRDLALIDKQVCDLIDLKHLRPILKEFGEYPASYRSLIWKSILCLPENQGAFVALINKGVHPAFTTLDKAFPLTNRSMLSTVKRLVSCLAYWSPIFIRVKYLPIFILPFTRVIKHDQFSCFEAVVTIIVNWCQGWFDFVPYPPLSVLDQVKRLLTLHNEELVNHYSDCNVTSDLYIWSLLETGFYEVLGWSEWQQLWDHVLSNHPAFLLFLVVAFNITCHTALMCLQQTDDFEHFFHTEVVVNMSQLLSKAYQLWSDTPADSHPRSQLKSFKPLVKGNMYQIFTDYPKHLLDQQLDKLSNLYEEQEALDSQKLEINKQKLELDADQRHVEEARLRDARLKELEEMYKHTLRKEESHLDDQRRSITATRRDLREKEVFVRSHTLDKTLQDKATKYAQLEQLMEQIGEKKSTAGFQSSTSWGSSQPSTDPSLLRIQHASVVHHLSKLKRLYQQSNMTQPQLKHCIIKFEDLLVRIETALELEQSTRQPRSCQSQQVLSLEEETQALEDEAQELLRRLSLSSETHQNPICLKRGQSSCYCCGDSKKSQ
ncbi:TBC1 domain family member 31 [Homalodisca vitripennis]|uniref:TBC1 domain family member 31 n=1 Tax=Homalodisca vitripennis TaxID=197043 RepID=UPI001EEBF7F5|nr:TBC1 domain family member 31 [Homalodisca vitripennis]XP_046660972.1 TBC1 domain family member 31 [Homalodisca vitripennis]